MFALFANPTRINDNMFAGHIVSRHRTLSAMVRALDRLQAPTRRANPGCHLDIQPMVLMADGLHGLRFSEEQKDEWYRLQADLNR